MSLLIKAALVLVYKEDNHELDQCCNLLPEIKSNKEKVEIRKMYPQTQMVRLVCAVTLFGLICSLFQATKDGKIPFFPHYALLIATAVGLGLTYYIMLGKVSRELRKPIWAWTHTINSLLFFANAWFCTLYWNMPYNASSISDSVLFRLHNAPALAISINFAVTDWLLLPKHSFLLCIIFFLSQSLKLIIPDYDHQIPSDLDHLEHPSNSSDLNSTHKI